jgi:hypothetical protein
MTGVSGIRQVPRGLVAHPDRLRWNLKYHDLPDDRHGATRRLLARRRP